jgi:hypothetical protein
LLRLFGFRVDSFPVCLARGGHDASFQPPREGLPCHGAPCSSTPQYPDCQFTCEPLTRLFPAWQSPGFTRCVAFVSPASWPVLQANPARPARQPLGDNCFSQLRAAWLAPNHRTQNHLRTVGKRWFQAFPTTPAATPPFGRQPYNLTPLPSGVNPGAGVAFPRVFSGARMIPECSGRVNPDGRQIRVW